MTDRELILRVTLKDDCDMSVFRVSGAGGQRRDKVSTGVRIVHRASGAVGKSSEDRSQHRNKQIAFRRMAESKEFERWRQLEVARLMGMFPVPIAQLVDKQLAPDNLLIEYRTGSGWSTVPDTVPDTDHSDHSDPER